MIEIIYLSVAHVFFLVFKILKKYIVKKYVTSVTCAMFNVLLFDNITADVF
jgi:hypothetical protein